LNHLNICKQASCGRFKSIGTTDAIPPLLRIKLNYTMKHSKTKIAAAALLAMALAQPAFALNITVNDNQTNGWGPGVGQGNEDQEVTSPAASGQQWDLEALVTGGPADLTIIAGFNLIGSLQGYDLGDIFIDADNDAAFAPLSGTFVPDGLNQLSNADFKFDYVISFTRTGGLIDGFKVYQLTEDASVVLQAVDDQNVLALRNSNPYKYVSGGTEIDSGSIAGGELTYTTGLSDAAVAATYGADVVVTGGDHNALSFVFNSFSLAVGNDPDGLADVKIALECGNDNIVGDLGGRNDVPDGGATLALLGLGLASLTLVGRKTVRR